MQLHCIPCPNYYLHSMSYCSLGLIVDKKFKMLLKCENNFQLLVCNEDELKRFTDPDSLMNIGDILVAAGFPHIEVTNNNRELAYECCLTYEVITHRHPNLVIDLIYVVGFLL